MHFQKLIALCFALCLLVASATAANWFVRPNGGTYGAENGTDWSNAYDGFADISWASISAGDTIWVAGGTYTQDLIPTKSGSSGNPIAIRRARADAPECTGATGWSAGFDSLITQTSASIEVNGNYDYIIISGKETATAAADNWAIGSRGDNKGWKVDLSALTSGNGFGLGTGGADNGTIEYLEFVGAGEINVSGDMRGIDFTPNVTASGGWTFSHLYIHDLESGIYLVNSSGNNIFEHISMDDIAPLNTASFHPNGLITWGGGSNVFRFNYFTKGDDGIGCGEGLFFEQSGGSSDWVVYGNVFHDLDYTGLKAIEITCAVGAIQVFNNTFADILVGSLYTSDSPSATGGTWKNNLNYLSSNNTIGTATSNITVSATNTFINYAGSDFRIVETTGTNYARQRGVVGSTVYTTDGFGTTYGSDGTWDAGAFEFDAGGGGGGSPTITTNNVRGGRVSRFRGLSMEVLPP